MALLGDAFQPFVLTSLTDVRGEGDISRTLADLIVAPGAAYDLAISNAMQTIDLDFRDPMIVALAIASDASRLSSAAFQSVSLVENDLLVRDNAAWGLVKLYYASFYAGHALMRLCGQGCSYFSKPHTTRLVALSNALGIHPTFKIEAGLYHCSVTSGGAALSCVRARGSVGGAHEAFWVVFGAFLNTAGELILRGNMTREDAQSVFVKLAEAVTLLNRNGGYSWLSAIRNDLQYRLSFGVWHPERRRAPTLRALSSLAAQWKQDPIRVDLAPPVGGALGEFASCCTFIVALCREVIWQVAARSSVGARSFVRTGPMALLNDIGVTP